MPAATAPGNMSTQQKLEEIVRDRDGPEGDRDVGHSNLAEEARKTPSDPTALHAVAERQSNLAGSILERGVAELVLPVKVMHNHPATRPEHTLHLGQCP